MKGNTTQRSRNYATVVYPESAPDNWIELLSDTHIPCFISPLHDKDINPNGEPKKAHYHVMIMFEGCKTVAQAQEIFDLIGGVGHETIASIRGYARYLIHADNPEKIQYDSDDVISLGGADYYNVCTLVTDKYVAICDMIDFIDSNNYTSFFDLLNYARLNRSDWFRILCDSGSYVIDKAIKSRTFSRRD